ncbi:MAG: hypothetical protein ABL957_10165 [Parvularculaceae bacterium]
MNNLSAHVVAYLGAAIFLGSFSLTGAALLGYGLQAELAKWMSGGAAAIVVGGVLIGAPAVFVLTRNANGKKHLPETAEAKPQIAGSTISAALSALARTAFIGLAARRPIAMIGLAALAGAFISTKADAEMSASPDRRRKSADAPT